jgi:hypothetical protein
VKQLLGQSLRGRLRDGAGSDGRGATHGPLQPACGDKRETPSEASPRLNRHLRAKAIGGGVLWRVGPASESLNLSDFPPSR